jgi:hypothetical protein
VTHDRRQTPHAARRRVLVQSGRLFPLMEGERSRPRRHAASWFDSTSVCGVTRIVVAGREAVLEDLAATARLSATRQRAVPLADGAQIRLDRSWSRFGGPATSCRPRRSYDR